MKNKDIITYYLNNLAHAKLGHRATESILEFAEEVSHDLFGFDVCHKWGASPRPRLGRRMQPSFSEEVPTPTCKRNSQTLRQILSQKKIIDISTPGIDKCTDCICDLFQLNDTERKIVQLFVNLSRTPILKGLANEVSEPRRYGLNINDLNIVGAFCNLSDSKLINALAPDNVLLHAGILRIDDDGEIILNRFVQRNIVQKIHNVKKLKHALLGAPHHGNLNLDFSHIATEYNYISNLIDNAVKKEISGINILIYGPTGTGKTALTKQIVSSLGYELYGLQTSNKSRQEKNINQSYLMHAQRILNNDKTSVIMLDEAEDIFAYNHFSSSATSKLSLNQLLETNTRPVIWLSNDIDCMDPAYIRRFTYCLELKKPDESVKIQIWQNICKNHRYKISQTDIKNFAKKYDIAPGIIDTAVRAAKLTGDKTAVERTIKSLCRAITGKVPNNNSDTSTNFDPSLLNTDLNIDQLTNQIISGGLTNFSLCLYGASGTGKSAYARHLAERMGIRIIHKRASDLIDKYVGETEKNIAAAFAQAAEQNAMLVFDEADSFLRDRTHARTSWEVSAVNEMLTQMESATIPFICTTNLMNDLDRASLRRFLFKIKYDYMTLPQVKSAFKAFFNLTPSDSDIRNLTHLTPGDFVVVKRKSDILNITDLSEIINMLALEISTKNIKHTNRIGFSG